MAHSISVKLATLITLPILLRTCHQMLNCSYPGYMKVDKETKSWLMFTGCVLYKNIVWVRIKRWSEGWRLSKVLPRHRQSNLYLYFVYVLCILYFEWELNDGAKGRDWGARFCPSTIHLVFVFCIIYFVFCNLSENWKMEQRVKTG